MERPAFPVFRFSNKCQSLKAFCGSYISTCCVFSSFQTLPCQPRTRYQKDIYKQFVFDTCRRSHQMSMPDLYTGGVQSERPGCSMLRVQCQVVLALVFFFNYVFSTEDLTLAAQELLTLKAASWKSRED